MVTDYFVQYTSMSFTMKALGTAALGLHWSSITGMLYEVMFWLLWLCYGIVMADATAASPARIEAELWLPRQLGGNKCNCGFYSSLSLLLAC